MFVTQGQVVYFALSAAFGGALGALRGLFPFRGRWTAAFDFCFAAFSAAGFMAAAFLWRFPDFRPYMAAGVLAGFLLVRGIFTQTVAKPLAKWYNTKQEKKFAAWQRETERGAAHKNAKAPKDAARR